MNMPGPLVSVVIGSHNQLNTLKFTLLALQDQPPDVPFEIIVVDSASTDGSGQFLATQAQTGAIRTILNQEDPGRTAARNQGAHAALGSYLMFLDPGMLVGPRWWKSLVRTLDMDPRVAAVAGKILLPDGRIDHAGLAVLEWWDEVPAGGETPAYGNRLNARSIQAGKPAGIEGANQPLRVQALTGEGLLVRASAFFAVGGFSARLCRDHHHQKNAGEGELAGVDLCLRLGSRGWDCVYRFESIMTRLRNALAADAGPSAQQSRRREQEVFNRTWLGRVRGDFKVLPEKGTVPTGQGGIRRYIEPVISFGEEGIPSAEGSRGHLARGMASVVVVTGDNLAETRVCVEALLAHTDEVHEIVAVDRGSTDGTAEYLARTLESRPNSLVIHGDRTMGPALAHNRGLAAARGKHVVLLSSQAVVTSRWLEILTATADLHGQAGLVGPVTNRAAGVQQIGQVDYDTASLRGLQSFAALLADGNAGSSRRAPRLSGFCLLIKRELMARIGGLDERFELGNYEDNDYCLRAHLAGYECLVAGGCYVHRGGTAEFTDEQIRHLTRIQQQWEIFKDKWGLPVSQNLGDPWDMSTLLAEGFSPGRHFQPLPEGAPTAVASAGRDRSSQTAHA